MPHCQDCDYDVTMSIKNAVLSYGQIDKKRIFPQKIIIHFSHNLSSIDVSALYSVKDFYDYSLRSFRSYEEPVAISIKQIPEGYSKR